MANKFKVVLDGVSYDMDFRENTVLVNDREFPWSVSGDTISVGGNPHTVAFKGANAVVDGISYSYEAIGLEQPKQVAKKKAASGAAGDEAGAVTAIMPGLILKLLKKEGEIVNAGDVVVILEAMKMQNELQAKKGGTVKKVFVGEGDKVEMRQVIMVIEE